MATKIYEIESQVRARLEEPSPRFWSSNELTAIIIDGIKELWRETVDLKEEHFLTENTADVTLPASSNALSGVPTDVHKIYLIEPLDGSSDSANFGLEFDPKEFNHRDFRIARSLDPVEPKDTVIYYTPIAAGAPVGAPTIKTAPQVTSAVSLRFVYIPTVSSSLATGSDVPIPGECDAALVARTVAYARAKEREDRAPDPGWLAIYERQKALVLKSLGVRNLQEPQLVDAVFQEYH